MGSKVSSPLTAAATATSTASNTHDTTSSMATLRTFTKARVACSNSVHELDSLNMMTTDWDCSNENIQTAALDLQLQCESAAKEASAIHEILTSFATSGDAPAWLWMELEVRQENAESAAKQVVDTIEQLAGAVVTEPSLQEMKRRAQLILPKIEGLKGMLNELQAQTQAQQLSGLPHEQGKQP